MWNAKLTKNTVVGEGRNTVYFIFNFKVPESKLKLVIDRKANIEDTSVVIENVSTVMEDTSTPMEDTSIVIDNTTIDLDDTSVGLDDSSVSIENISSKKKIAIPIVTGLMVSNFFLKCFFAASYTWMKLFEKIIVFAHIRHISLINKIIRKRLILQIFLFMIMLKLWYSMEAVRITERYIIRLSKKRGERRSFNIMFPTRNAMYYSQST